MNDPQSSVQRVSLLIGGNWRAGVETFEAFDKYSGSLFAIADRASKAQADAAISAARESFAATRLEPYDRYRVLNKAAELIEKRRATLARCIVVEAGFPYIDPEDEVRWSNDRRAPYHTQPRLGA